MHKMYKGLRIVYRTCVYSYLYLRCSVLPLQGGQLLRKNAEPIVVPNCLLIVSVFFAKYIEVKTKFTISIISSPLRRLNFSTSCQRYLMHPRARSVEIL